MSEKRGGVFAFRYRYTAPTAGERREIECIRREYRDVNKTFTREARFVYKKQTFRQSADAILCANDARRDNTMNASEQKAVEEIRGAYVQKEESGLDRLRRLDRAARRPAQIFAYVFGAAGTLVLGTGMCLAMEVIGALPALGIAVGLAGIAMVACNLFIYRALLGHRRKKYAPRVLELSGELLGAE